MRDPFIKVPFASSGDKSPIPDATQPNGSISMQSGWGVDYEKEVGVDPAAKTVNRQDMNQAFFLVSALLNRWQTESFPEWVDSAANAGSPLAYPIGTVVRYPNGSDFVLRVSLVNNNIATPSPTQATEQWGDPMPGLNLKSATEALVGISRFATQAETNTGALDTVAVTPLKVAAAFGIGQALNNNANSKYLRGVTYTNTTKKPILVRVRAAVISGQIGTGVIFFQGLESSYSSTDSNSPLALNTPVPAGATWSYDLTNTSNHQISVLE